MSIEVIKLLGGSDVQVDFSQNEIPCRKCNKPIRFATTRFGKYIPIIKIGNEWQAHFADCQFAGEFRKKLTPAEARERRKQKKIAEIHKKYNSLSDEEKRKFNFYQKI